MRGPPVFTVSFDTSIKKTVASAITQDRERPDRFLPLKPLVLDVLLELADGKRHGWSLIRDIQQRDGGDRILPANFYRTLRALRDDGLIEQAKGKAGEDPAERRQYFGLTSLGIKVARAEVKRLEAIVVDPRARRLLKGRLRANASVG